MLCVAVGGGNLVVMVMVIFFRLLYNTMLLRIMMTMRMVTMTLTMLLRKSRGGLGREVVRRVCAAAIAGISSLA